MSKSILKNSIYKILLNCFNLLVPLLVTPYIAGLLDEELFGIYNTANAMMGFFLVFSVFGVYHYGVREISRVRHDRKALSDLFSNLFSFSIITSVGTSLVYLLYVLFAVEPSSRATYLIMLIQICGNIVSVEWMNEAAEDYGFITVKTILVRLGYLVSIFLFVRTPLDVVPYGLVMSLSVFVNNLFSFFYVRRRVKIHFKGVQLKPYVKPLFTLLLVSNVNILYTQLDKILLGQFVSPVANTEYSLPSNIINMITAMLVSLLMVSVPRLSLYLSNGQKREYLSLLRKSTQSFFLFLCPALVGLFCLSPEAMRIYTNNAYTYAYPVLMAFSARMLVSSWYSIFTHQILYLFGKENVMVKILLFGGILNAVFDLLLLWWGWLTPLSAVLSTALAELIMLLIMYRYIRVNMGVPFRLFSRRNMKYLIFSLPFLPISWLVRLFTENYLISAAVTVVLCVGCYGGLLLLSGDELLQYVLDRLFGRFKKKNKV